MAWPIVPGEDPGLVSDLTDPGELGLLLVAFVAGVAWAGWRLWSGQLHFRFGLVDVGLLGFVALAFIGAPLAGYKRSAWLTAWHWAALALLFFLTRQLVTRAGEQTALMAALLAGAVALSAQGLYQVAVELPQTARAIEKESDRLEELPQRQGSPSEEEREATRQRNLETLLQRQGSPSEEEREVTRQRILGRQASATYFHPAALAGVLVLCLPGLVGATAACVRGGAPGWQTALAGLSALAAMTALCLTRLPLTLAALLVAGALALGFLARKVPARQMGVAALGLLAAAGVGYGLFAAGVLGGDLGIDRWREYQRVGWRVAKDYPWHGVGAGNFGLLYPRYMDPAGDKVSHPHNAVLEVAATFGLPALAALLATLVWFFYRATRLTTDSVHSQDGQPVPEQGGRSPRWEFYLGGSLGMLLGFGIRAGSVPPEDLYHEAVAAALRILVWFAVMGALERVPWSPGNLRVSLLAGVGGLLLVLLGAGGINWPSLVAVLCVAMGLALVVGGEPYAGTWTTQPALRLLPLPVLLALGFSCFTFGVYPASANATSTLRALRQAQLYFNDVSKPPEQRVLSEPHRYVQKKIISALRDAERDDPDNFRTRLYLAEWYGQLWGLQTQPGEARNIGHTALTYVSVARGLEPYGPETELAEYGLRSRFRNRLVANARQLETEAGDAKNKVSAEARKQALVHAQVLKGDAREQTKYGIESLRRAIEKDPTSARVVFRLAQDLFLLDQKEEGREQASKALELDERVSVASRRLTAAQRLQIHEWLGQEASR